MSLDAGASLSVESNLRLEVLQFAPGTLKSSGGSYFTRSLVYGAQRPNHDSSMATVFTWPFSADDRLFFRFHGQEYWQTTNGSWGLRALTTSEPVTGPLEVRLLPHAARIQFELPSPVTLPEVTDLFDIEISDEERFNDLREIAKFLSQALQIELPSTLAFPDTQPSGTTVNLDWISKGDSDRSLRSLLRYLHTAAAPDEDYWFDDFLFAVTERPDSLWTRLVARMRRWLP